MDVPAPLKKFVKTVLRGFYTAEQAIVVDYLIHYPCIKDDDLAELLKFDKRHLRSLLQQLKKDYFVKIRMVRKRGSDGKDTNQQHYYINYEGIVNVVKYKLDHMSRNLETVERDLTNRGSFKCTLCTNVYTDLDMNQLFDLQTGELVCTYCRSLVIEEDKPAPQHDDTNLTLGKFNRAMEPLYVQLKEVENIRLAKCLLHPEPLGLSINRGHGVMENQGRVWSGDSTKFNINFGYESIQSTQIEREQPRWMTSNAVPGSEINPTVMKTNQAMGTTISFESSQIQDEIMNTLLLYENFGQTTSITSYNPVATSVVESNESDNEEMVTENEEEEALIEIGNKRIPLGEITHQHVSSMTPREKDSYTQIFHEVYSPYYDML